MLVYSRKAGESTIVGEGDDAVRVMVLGVDGGRVRLGFDGPKRIRIDREEIRQRIDGERLATSKAK